MKNYFLFTLVAISLASVFTVALSNIGQANAHHEQILRKMGIGYNDYDHDGVTCAATDAQADAWSDRFYNHHNPNINKLIACENKEASYAGLPDYADNVDHIQNLIDQWKRMYGPGSGWAESFGDG